MSIALPPLVSFPAPLIPTTWSLADVQAHLGDVPPSRIRAYPPPGMATEEDAFRIHAEQGVLCELVDGVLVEKDMGAYESMLAIEVAYYLRCYLKDHPIGFLMGADGPVRPRPGKMRLPDVSFFSWGRFPTAEMPAEKVINLSPDLAVEILSEGNTEKEMDRKLDEYFSGGTRLAWIIDPQVRTALVYTSRMNPVPLTENDALEGGEVLPGFKLVMRDLFNAVPRSA